MLILLPSSVISPVVGSSKPATIRSVVVFPQPDGPSKVTNSPFFTSRLKSSTAVTSPYIFTMFLSSIMLFVPEFLDITPSLFITRF